MANNIDGPEITLNASATLAGKQFYIVMLLLFFVILKPTQ